MVDAIINAMVAIVHQHQLSLMDRYPRDLLVHDRAVLERIAVPGASAAWIVGHSHTGLTQLGIHRNANQMVGCYGKSADSDDRFYRIDFGVGELGFRFTELDRAGFMALQNSYVPYERSSYGDTFNLLKADRNLGQCRFECIDGVNHQYKAHISPTPGATKLDRAALYEWVTQDICDHGTLFAKWTVHWHETEAQAELEPA